MSQNLIPVTDFTIHYVCSVCGNETHKVSECIDNKVRFYCPTCDESEWVEQAAPLTFEINAEWNKPIIYFNHPAYQQICMLLVKHGFQRLANGDMERPSTGCGFSAECLLKYKTLAEFKAEWPYT